MNEKIFTSQDALRLAEEIRTTKYPDSAFCIASGSIIRGKGTILSDLDLIVVYSEINNARRESYFYKEMPIEAFIHDYETIQFFIYDDYNNASASMMNMITTGITIPFENDISNRLIAYARMLLDKGPSENTKQQNDFLLYRITDLVDDLRGDRSLLEQQNTLYTLYPLIGELALRKHHSFIASGKYLARYLEQYCPEVLPPLNKVMNAAHSGTFGKQEVQIIDDLIQSLGGFLFDGYAQPADPDKRAKAIWLEE